MSNNLFLHEEKYRGDDLVTKLNRVPIVICGAGALGSNLTETLVRQGLDNIEVIDKDRVVTHNVSTQIYTRAEIGSLKVSALQKRMFVCTGVEIAAHHKELTKDNAENLLKNANLVVDCFDNTPSRQLVQDACRKLNIDCLHCGLYQDYGELVWDERYKVRQQPPEGDPCDEPLARNIIILTITVAAEEILDYILSIKPRKKDWSITLRDLKIISAN